MADLRVPEINYVALAGRLTRDPDLKHTPSGLAICEIGLAVSRFYRSKDGERKEDTLFINVTVFDKQAEFLGDKLRKGRPIYVEGSLNFDQWEDKNTGQKRSKIDVRARRVQMLDWDDDGGGQRSGSSGRDYSNQGGGGPAPEDDIPF
jgi:single-strand DNA-binding protein